MKFHISAASGLNEIQFYFSDRINWMEDITILPKKYPVNPV